MTQLGTNNFDVEELSVEQRAIALYEQGAEKEATGLMSDAIKFYSKALRLHEGVERIYRQKLQDQYRLQLAEREAQIPRIARLSKDLEGLSVKDGDEQDLAELEPCWLLEMLPNDILLEVIAVLIHIDPHSYVSFATTCRKLSKLSFDKSAYKHLSKIIYPSQRYSSTAYQLNNISSDQLKMVEMWDFNWEAMLNDRPFLKYRGVYISKVSYISEGARDTSFYAPVKLVTYFRYIRFYPDGHALKLTTTDEPQLIVPHFHVEEAANWKHTTVSRFSIEMDGRVVITSRTEDYEFVEELEIVSLGYRKFHRLNWISSFTVNAEGERGYFSLKKEKPFNFSGVKSYNVSY